MRVLLVEHDPAMVRVLERGLRSHGFEVTSFEPRAAGAPDDSISVVVVDLSPSTAATRKVLHQLESSQLPRLLLASSEDLVRVPPGATCLTKPFAMEELISRLYALTRSNDGQRKTILTAGDLRLDLLARCAWRGDRLIDLPSREFALLEYFIRHPRRVLSRPEILADVWGYHLQQNASNSNVVDVYVRYLRNRLQATAEQPIIATVRGEGYQFDLPTESASVARTTRRRAPATSANRHGR